MPLDNPPDDIVFGINPVREAFRADLRVERAFINKPSGAASSILSQLRARGVPIVEVTEDKLNALCGGGQPNHQGIALRIAAAAYVETDELLNRARMRNEEPFLLLLDGITDPQNFGAILRSAEAMGAHGVIIPKRRSTGLTAVAFRASSGAAAHIGVAQVSNLAQTIDELKTKGLWIVGTQASAPPCYEQNLTGGVVLCIGSEGEGLARLTLDKCDFLVGVPLYGKVESLNASCAASVLLYEVNRQRHAKG